MKSTVELFKEDIIQRIVHHLEKPQDKFRDVDFLIDLVDDLLNRTQAYLYKCDLCPNYYLNTNTGSNCNNLNFYNCESDKVKRGNGYCKKSFCIDCWDKPNSLFKYLGKPPEEEIEHCVCVECLQNGYQSIY